MSRFFALPENVDLAQSRIIIEKDEAHHIIDVMRMKEGDKTIVFDGTGNEYTGFIETLDVRAKRLIVCIIKTKHPGPEKIPEVYLAQAIPKKGKMDNIVEKATELGVKGIIPVVSERTIVRPDRADALKMRDRWTKIAVVASKQSGRLDVPDISPVIKFNDLVLGASEYDTVLFACLNEDTIPFKEAVSGIISGSILVLVGPEGDFTTKEIDTARHNNSKFVSLGSRVLKSDTAGIFMLSVLSYEFTR